LSGAGFKVQRVLVLEKDRKTAERLEAALKQRGDVSVSIVPTMREACLIVAQVPQELAFVPLADAEQLLHSLRALQPDLKMVLTTADLRATMPEDYRDVFQGLVHSADLEEELPVLFRDGLLKKDSARPGRIAPGRRMEGAVPPSLSRLNKACEETGISQNNSPVQLAVLSYAGQVIGSYGDGAESYALAVADLIGRNWQKGQFTAQLQYLQLPDYYDARLVYSRSVAGAVLSLVAEPETPVGELRKQADRLARRLSDGREETGENVQSHFTAVGRSYGAGTDGGSSSYYAIAWRPVKPLPSAVQNIVRDCVAALAEENKCRLRHLSVTSMIVHIVIECPAGRTAAWVVFLMKSGVNNEIQRQFGIQSSIWQKGFFATESDQPLSETELKMLLTT
jgi:hypothetical protein